MTPTRAVATTDIPERCQIGIGQYGYVFANGQPIKFRPQHARFPENMVVVSGDDFLSGRDYDYFSMVQISDWRRGQGQMVYDPRDPISKARFFRSKYCDIRNQARLIVTRDISTIAGSPASATAIPLRPAGGFMYVGDASSVKFHADWTAGATSAATSAAGLVSALTDDGQSVFGVVDGVGINKWAIGSAAAGTLFNATSTAYKRLLYANRLLFAVTAATLYSINAAGTSTALFTPPTGWTFRDLCQRRGGAIDSPILVLATNGERSFIWYWDGALIHDYLELPTGFIGYRIEYALGAVFINGLRINPDGTFSPCAYYIESDRVGFLGYFGTEQATGNPTENGANVENGYAIDAYDGNVYFAVSKPATGSEIWTYSVVNGGISRWFLTASLSLGDIAIYRGGPWISVLGQSVHKARSTFASTGQLETSDIHYGQPWATMTWITIESAFAPLLTGESIQIEYSTDQGATFTTAGTASTVGQKKAAYIISSSSTTVASPFIRLRITLTPGGGLTTSPELFSYALKASTNDPRGILMEAILACPHSYSKDGNADFQGTTGSERIRNILDLYDAQGIVKLLYMAPNTSRDRLVRSVDVKIVDYELIEPSSTGLKNGEWVAGDIKVVVREANV